MRKVILKIALFIVLCVFFFIFVFISAEWSVSAYCRKYGNYSVYLLISGDRQRIYEPTVIFSVNDIYKFLVNSIQVKFEVHSDSFIVIGNSKKIADEMYFTNKSVEKLLHIDIEGDTVFKIENAMQALNRVKIHDTVISYKIGGNVWWYIDSVRKSFTRNHSDICKVNVYVTGTVCCTKKGIIQLLKCLNAKCYIRLNRKCQELYAIEKPIELKCLHFW